MHVRVLNCHQNILQFQMMSGVYRRNWAVGESSSSGLAAYVSGFHWPALYLLRMDEVLNYQSLLIV
jgi:hypothetical protein